MNKRAKIIAAAIITAMLSLMGYTVHGGDVSEGNAGGELELLARCIEAEAGNQSVLGRRLVVDVILNRVDSRGYPGSIKEVILQPGQFAVVDSGAIDTAVPSAETWRAISRELTGRISDEIIYFQTGSYPAYGTPWEHVGDHYFSSEGK